MGIDLVGAAIYNRFIAEGRPGTVMHNAGSFSTRFNGGIRTTAGFHNQIGILSEEIWIFKILTSIFHDARFGM